MQRWQLGPVEASAVAVVLSLAQAASAQTSAAVAGPATPPAPARSGDDQSRIVPFSGFVLAAPMRLTLEGSILPKAGGFPQCASLEDDVGNSVGGIPVQHYRDWRLTPRLVLSAFTQLGCPIDAGVGAVVTYTVPLRPSVGWVFAAGAYAAPGQFQLFGGVPSALSLAWNGASAPAAVSARTDLVWKAADGHPYNVGVQALGHGRRQITFGAGF
ncbi:MAG: hypothetical protein JOZ69_01615 [Myxococcales bacterium]|nr:hypothetical protein [Myxococcales bacterium]